MKNYLVAGILFAIPASLFGMFSGIQEIEKKFAVPKPDKAYETIKILPDSDGKGINIISFLKGDIPGTFGFFSSTVDLAKLTITLTTDATGTVKKSTRVVYGPQLSPDLTSAVMTIKNRGFNVEAESITDWEKKHREIYDDILGKDGAINTDVAFKFVQNFYDELISLQSDNFYFAQLFRNLALYKKEPVIVAQLAPKLNELAYALLSLR